MAYFLSRSGKRGERPERVTKVEIQQAGDAWERLGPTLYRTRHMVAGSEGQPPAEKPVTDKPLSDEQETETAKPKKYKAKRTKSQKG